jgi:beta-N-acetylhexosaminidase
MSGMRLRRQVGQLMVVGLEGVELTALERAWLKLLEPGGVILFRRNLEEAGQVVKLLGDCAALAATPQLRCVDLEGGLVDRLRDLIAPMPSPAAVFASGKRGNFVKHGRLIGQEAKALGFHATFAPVLDLALPASAAVMRTRVASGAAKGVIAYAKGFLDGLERERILGCGKHFPGLGGGALDSHESLPVIERSWDELWKNDLAVFRALAPRLPMMMVAHASYPLTKDTKPASVSRYWMSDVLRRKMRYKGLVLSDDLEMGGILTQASIEEAAVGAIAAGADMVEICKDPALVLRAYEALLGEAERSKAFRRRVEESCRRVLAHKRRHVTGDTPRVPSGSAVSRLQAAVRAFAGEVGA